MPVRRRDRHGRGLRGVLVPADVPGLPGAPSRADRFDVLVLDSVQRLERLRPDLADRLAQIEVAVEQVPPVDAVGSVADPVTLGRAVHPRDGGPARVVVHRRAVEARAAEGRSRALLVHHVVVDQVARLLGLEPEDLDPDHLPD